MICTLLAYRLYIYSITCILHVCGQISMSRDMTLFEYCSFMVKGFCMYSFTSCILDGGVYGGLISREGILFCSNDYTSLSES